MNRTGQFILLVDDNPDDVEMTLTHEIPEGDHAGLCSGGVGDRGLEGSIAVAEQHVDHISAGGPYDKVEDSVMPEAPGGSRCGG